MTQHPIVTHTIARFLAPLVPEAPVTLYDRASVQVLVRPQPWSADMQRTTNSLFLERYQHRVRYAARLTARVAGVEYPVHPDLFEKHFSVFSLGLRAAVASRNVWLDHYGICDGQLWHFGFTSHATQSCGYWFVRSQVLQTDTYVEMEVTADLTITTVLSASVDDLLKTSHAALRRRLKKEAFAPSVKDRFPCSDNRLTMVQDCLAQVPPEDIAAALADVL